MLTTPAPLLDPVTTYAQQVVDGVFPAGPIVRGACARHLRDLAAGVWTWDLPAVHRVLGFFRDVLRVDNTSRKTDDEPDTVPFEPIHWQAFILGSLFGWKGPDGYRRFRTAYVETAKGSGKSPLAAGIGLYMEFADGEYRAEVYAAARTKDQARVLFRDAVTMVKASPALMKKKQFSGGDGKEYNIAYLARGAFFRVVASDTGQSGPRPHCALLDEIHEHPDDEVVTMMRAGTKGRKQALIFMITNSGHDKTTVCWNYHQYAAEVCAGTKIDEAFFGYVCALDEGDNPLEDESVWGKANPSLGITFGMKYLRELVTEARGMPSKEAKVLRLNFCVWTEAEDPWIDLDRWESAQRDGLDIDTLRGLPCFLGLDLSMLRDLTALVACWLHPDGKKTIRAWFWKPAENVASHARTDGVPYELWRDQGFMAVTPGRIIDREFVAVQVRQLCQDHRVIAAAFDHYQIGDFLKSCDNVGFDVWIDKRPRDEQGNVSEPDGQGLRLVPHGQGHQGANSKTAMWMNRSVQALESAIIGQTLEIVRNPLLTWNSLSAVLILDAQENRKWDKRKSTGRIDGIVAASMAVGLASLDQPSDVRSIWDRPDLFTDPDDPTNGDVLVLTDIEQSRGLLKVGENYSPALAERLAGQGWITVDRGGWLAITEAGRLLVARARLLE